MPIPEVCDPQPGPRWPLTSERVPPPGDNLVQRLTGVDLDRGTAAQERLDRVEVLQDACTFRRILAVVVVVREATRCTRTSTGALNRTTASNHRRTFPGWRRSRRRTQILRRAARAGRSSDPRATGGPPSHQWNGLPVAEAWACLPGAAPSAGRRTPRHAMVRPPDTCVEGRRHPSMSR